MSTAFKACVVLLSVCVATAGAEEKESKPDRLGFTRTAVNGERVVVRANGEPRVTVICFLGSECPLARLYGARLTKLAADFQSLGVQLVGINSNQHDSVDDIRRYISEYTIGFPMVRDEGNVIADRYGATRTPEVFVLDQSLTVRYHGRIDDQYEPGIARTTVTRNHLQTAIEELLAGKPVSVPFTEPTGCYIGKVEAAEQPPNPTAVTYTREVSRVLQKHCLECHRSGEIGPFSLEDYDEVVGWGSTIVEVVDNGRMPPWHADPAVGKFANARHMPEADKQILRDWVAAGRTRGDVADLPAPLEYTAGWQLPSPPDLVVPMRDRPYRVPSEGTVEYQYFVVDPGFTEDKWVTAAQVIPGARQAVHHAIVFVRPPDGARFRGIGWLTAYVPGQRLCELPNGYARRVPAGSKLVFQMHYTTNGVAQDDVSRVGIKFADGSTVTHEVLTLIGIDQEFEIPPQAENFEVSGEIQRLPAAGEVLAITPHMHYRGKAFRIEAERAGRSEPLLHVPNYQFDWQHAYILEKPLPLADVDSLRFSVWFDNSAKNPLNPDPTQWVTWGDQSWEEMAVCFLEVAEPLGKGSDSRRRSPAVDSAERELKIKAFIDDFFRKLDLNQDGVLTRSEAPLAVRRVSFHSFDRDGDERITRDEVRLKAEELFPGSPE